MFKFLKNTLYILILLLYSSNLEYSIASNTNKNSTNSISNKLKPSATFHNKVSGNISITKTQFDKFKANIKDEIIAEQALMLSASAINNLLYNTKEFKYLCTYSGINTWSYLDAMKNGLTKFINNISKQKIKINNLSQEDYSNSLLDKVSEFYIQYSIDRNNKTIENFLSENKGEIDKTLLNKIIDNFDALGFNRIIYQVIKGTGKVKEILDNKNKINNKELSEDTNNEESDDTKVFIKLDNPTGTCWLNSAFQLLYTTAINSDNLSDTTFYKFIQFLKIRQKEWKQEIKNKDYKEIISEEKKLVLNGVITSQKYRVLTDKINLIGELENFEKQAGNNDKYPNIITKEQLDKWNKKPGVIAAKQELNKLKEMQSQGSNEIHGIKLLLNIFPELKSLFYIKYSEQKYNVNISEEQTVFGNTIQEEVIALNNMLPGKKEYMPHCKILTQAVYSTGLMAKDEVINTNIKHVKEFPKYLIVNGFHYDNHNADVLVSGLDFNELHNNYISGFDENGKLIIYELSSIGMSKDVEVLQSQDENSSKGHGYALYKSNDNWYVMNDNNPYKKLSKTEFEDIIESDKASTFIYKKLYYEKEIKKDKKYGNNNKGNEDKVIKGNKKDNINTDNKLEVTKQNNTNKTDKKNNINRNNKDEVKNDSKVKNKELVKTDKQNKDTEKTN